MTKSNLACAANNPKGIASPEPKVGAPGIGRNRVAVGDNCWTVTQGSSFLATLGFGSQPRPYRHAKQIHVPKPVGTVARTNPQEVFGEGAKHNTRGRV